jgi:hypothetical protein
VILLNNGASQPPDPEVWQISEILNKSKFILISILALLAETTWLPGQLPGIPGAFEQ